MTYFLLACRQLYIFLQHVTLAHCFGVLCGVWASIMLHST